MDAKTKAKALKLCALKNHADDRLGRYSDHEGTEEGPTWANFRNMSVDEFENLVDYTAEQNRNAMRALRGLLRIKRTGR